MSDLEDLSDDYCSCKINAVGSTLLSSVARPAKSSIIDKITNKWYYSAMSEVLNSGFQPEVYDEQLYEAFRKASVQANMHLNGDPAYRGEQKARFLVGDIENPTLDYPDLDLGRLGDAENSFLTQKQALLANEQNPVVKQAYRWVLNERIAELRMLKAAATGDMGGFRRYSEFIYGRPSADIFAYTVHSIRAEAQTAVVSDDQNFAASARNLLQILPELPVTEISALPDTATVQIAHQQTIAELGSLIDLPEAEQKLDAEQIQTAFSAALQKLGGSDWQVMIDSQTSRTAIGVNQAEQAVKIPEARMAKRDGVVSLIVHEIGTHVARRINGERTQLRLLGLGLDRAEQGEEGVATMREQALRQEVDDFRGLDGHLAIGLAVGVDGHPRDFRQVYQILEQYFLLKNFMKGIDSAQALDKAQTTAWNRCVRTFRGTDCKTLGVCLTKDIIYREGSIGVWDVIRENPVEMRRFNIGKYDPANPRHLWVLEQLGITDEDLVALEK